MPSPLALSAGEVSQAPAGRPGVRWGSANGPPWICIQRTTGRRAWGGHPSIAGALEASSGVLSRSTSHSGEEQTNFTTIQEHSSRAQRASASSAPVGTKGVVVPQRAAGCRGLPHLSLSSFTIPARPAGWCGPPGSAPCHQRQLGFPGMTGAAIAADAAAPPGLFSGARRLRVLLQGLQLGQGDDIAILRPGAAPSALGAGVVVVEARRVGVEELPPLVLAGPRSRTAGRRVPPHSPVTRLAYMRSRVRLR